MDDADSSTHKSFGIIDCAVFAGMLAISAVVGVYQAYKSRKNEDAVREYLVGGQNMSIFPITMSLIASYISGITILGFPAEMYVYGTQLWCVVIADSFVSLTMAVVYLPVFYGLGITSSYEYLNLRFNGVVRFMGSAIFLIKMLLYIPLVIYVPALAFNQVTGMNLHAIAVLVCAVCIFYTTLGGLKAVVWTDAIQTIVMFGGVIVIAVIGTNQVGGFSEVWKRNRDTDRIQFFESDGAAHLLDRCHRQLLKLVGKLFRQSSDGATMLGYAQFTERQYNNCDHGNRDNYHRITELLYRHCYLCGVPRLRSYFYQAIKKPDQLLPFFVMELTESIPGLPGLFVAGVFSAALSTMSTGLNSMSGVIYEDMIKPWLRIPLSEIAVSRLMKLTVVLTGIFCVTLVFLVEKLGGLIQAGKSLASITAGPLLGIFTLGMFFPIANSSGALVGGLISLNLVAWISFGTQAAISSGKIHFPVKPVSIEGCSESLKNHATNLSLIVETAIKEQPFFLYRMSYLWYTWVGFLTAILVGLLVSWITGLNKCKPGDEKLYTPVIRSFLRDSTTIIKREQETIVELEKMDRNVTKV
ncbi:sodium-coupled monocarboxylate transporter 2 [Apis florea]|uniref:sodium-coupled monocarboxylate transporter 2 n=1 Tax=Apis florea TaxID=7463 RepID=UPI0012FF5290|nr:sodium-coupled monocarboxylate transporter 2 [Apis florea]